MRLLPRSPERRQPAVARLRRWLAAWLVAAVVLAALLLANAVRDYLFVWRILAAQQVRHGMTQYVADLEQSLRREGTAPGVVPAELLASEEVAPPDGTAWIEVRRSDGTVLARRGEPGTRTFTAEEEALRFRAHEPLSRVVARPSGDLVVEAMAIRAGRRPVPPTAPPPPGGRPPLVIEMAAPLAIQDASVLWPIRRNLLVNSAGAFALLVTVVVAALGFRAYERGRRLEGQLEIARAVQSKLLPSRVDHGEAVQIAAAYRPAEQVGGDFYDVFATPTRGVALVLGDVSGKGVPAALLAGVIHGAVRSSPWHASPQDMECESERLNRLLCANSPGNRFASMFWCYHDPATRRLRYVNAGHCRPVLVRRAEPDTPALLHEGGPVLGLLSDASYAPASHDVCAGDVLVLYSDGLVECTNPAGDEFGEARLLELLRGRGGHDPEAICGAISGSVGEFLAGRPPQDDLTLLVARFS